MPPKHSSGKHSRSGGRSGGDSTPDDTPNKICQQQLAALATPHGNRGLGPGNGNVATGGQPDVDASISELRDAMAVLPPSA